MQLAARTFPTRPELTPDDYALYADLLSELSVEQLDACWRKAMKSCEYFPVPAQILAQVEKAHDNAKALDAEGAWQKLLRYIEQHYLGGDVGLRQGAPQLPPAIAYAALAAGGIAWIEGCPQDQVQWAKKNFLEAYQQYSSSSDLALYASDADARKVLAEAAQQMREAKSLPVAAPSTPAKR